MEVIFHNNFLKLYSKASSKVKKRFENCLAVFHKNPFDIELRNHPLKGKWSGFRSIDITGDWRAVYRQQTETVAEFYAIGKHSQLYR